jgi:hypothetical protein
LALGFGKLYRNQPCERFLCAYRLSNVGLQKEINEMDTVKLGFGFDAKRCRKSLTVLGVIVLALVAMQPYVSTQAMNSAGAKSLSPSLPSTANLTLVALNGTGYFLSSSQISSLPSVTGPGGSSSIDNYTGVSLETLANLVGGLNSSEVLAVVGSDGYTKNFTYAQVVNGDFSGYTYNKTTGNPTSPTKPIVAMIAYYQNSQLIPNKSNGGSGPLMSAIVGNDSLITPGKYWVWWADKVMVLRATSVPEFPAVTLVPLFTALTLIALVSSIRLGRKYPKKPLSAKHDEGG